MTSAWLQLTVKDEQLPRGAKPLDGRLHAVDFFFVHVGVRANGVPISVVTPPGFSRPAFTHARGRHGFL